MPNISGTFQAQQGEVAMVANLADPGYALELSSPVPYVGFVSIIAWHTIF